MQRFQDLKVWQRGHSLVLEVYRWTESFPKHERYGIVSQIRRAAASIPTNIAEGSKRQTRPDYARFLNIAEGSLAELEYLVVLSRDLRYLPTEPAATLSDAIVELQRMLCALRE